MLNFRRLLEKRNSPVGVGLVGATYMGVGIMNAVRRAVGMELVAAFDRDEDSARAALETYAPEARFLDLEELCADGAVEVVVDGTASPELGAQVAMLALQNRKHVVSINIECDVTVGHVLAARAEEHGLVYTVTAGDEPGELKALYDHYDALGFRVVALGKGKNNPLNPRATPDDVRANLPHNGITAEQVTSFVDGSKTMCEMGCIGNAVGLGPDVPGMHGPCCTIAEIGERFRAGRRGGILQREGVVDFVTGSEISGGVWIVVHSDDPRLCSDFAYLRIGSGPYFVFHQRHHNWFVDTPLSILRAALVNAPTVTPLARPTCRVVAVAKRNLKAKETLDGVGGYSTHGTLMREEDAVDLLPLGLSQGVALKRDIPTGDAIRLSDVEQPEPSDVWTLWRSHRPLHLSGVQ